jgi:hypothetical protein
MTRQLAAAFALTALAGCGVDSASTAATAAAVKKQEVEQGKTNMGQMQQNIGQALEQGQQRAQRAGDAEK